MWNTKKTKRQIELMEKIAASTMCSPHWTSKDELLISGFVKEAYGDKTPLTSFDRLGFILCNKYNRTKLFKPGSNKEYQYPYNMKIDDIIGSNGIELHNGNWVMKIVPLGDRGPYGKQFMFTIFPKEIPKFIKSITVKMKLFINLGFYWGGQYQWKPIIFDHDKRTRYCKSVTVRDYHIRGFNPVLRTLILGGDAVVQQTCWKFS